MRPISDPIHPEAPAARITCQRHPHTALSTTPQVTPAAVTRCVATISSRVSTPNAAASTRWPTTTNSTARLNRTNGCTATTATGRSTSDAPAVRPSSVRLAARLCPRPTRSGAIRSHHAALHPQLAASHAARSASVPETEYLTSCRDSAVVSEPATGTSNPGRRPVPIGPAVSLFKPRLEHRGSTPRQGIRAAPAPVWRRR